MVKYSPPSEGVREAEAGGNSGRLYLTVYPDMSPNTGSISFFIIIMLMIPTLISLTITRILPRECTVKYIPGLRVIQ